MLAPPCCTLRLRPLIALYDTISPAGGARVCCLYFLYFPYFPYSLHVLPDARTAPPPARPSPHLLPAPPPPPPCHTDRRSLATIELLEEQAAEAAALRQDVGQLRALLLDAQSEAEAALRLLQEQQQVGELGDCLLGRAPVCCGAAWLSLKCTAELALCHDQLGCQE